MTALRERLAKLEHEQWVAWSQSLANTEPGISEARIDRWTGMWVPYDQLTEAQKDMDREWADKVLAALADDAPRLEAALAPGSVTVTVEDVARRLHEWEVPDSGHDISDDVCGLSDSLTALVRRLLGLPPDGGR